MTSVPYQNLVEQRGFRLPVIVQSRILGENEEPFLSEQSEWGKT